MTSPGDLYRIARMPTAAPPTLPQPTGGELIIDDEGHMVHGVALIGPWSRNDGAEIETSAHTDFAELINNFGDPVPLHYHHHNRGETFDSNGGIINAYVDGSTLRGTHKLNPKKPTTGQILVDARDFKRNLCYSFEAFEKDLEYKRGANGRTIVGAKGLRWFAFGKECGTTQGMNNTLRGETLMADKQPTTVAELKAQFPGLADELATSVRAETAAVAEVDTKVSDLETENTQLKTDLQESKDRVAELEALEADRERRKSIETQWADLIKDVDLSLIPDTDEGKRISAKAELGDDYLKSLLALDGEAVTAQLQDRADGIKAVVTIAETHKGVPSKKVRTETTPTVVPKGDDETGDGPSLDDLFAAPAK